MVTLILSHEDRAKQIELPALKQPFSHSIPGTDFKVHPNSRSLIDYGLTTQCVALGTTGAGCCGFLGAADIAPQGRGSGS